MSRGVVNMVEIKEMYNDFYKAYSFISFSPEKRAEQCVIDFSNELKEDLKELPSEGNYKEKYIEHIKKWANAKSKTMSSMVAGPSNFPVNRNRKAMDREQGTWEEFRRWRKRYIKRANTVKTKSPEEEIDDTLIELEKTRNNHQLMKDINVIIRKKVGKEEKLEMLKELGLKRGEEFLLSGPFPGCSLTNSNARIRNLEKKLVTMRARIERKETFERITFDGGYIDIEKDRVIIKHDEKPARSVIDNIKSYGFRWSPKFVCWCRKHTLNAIRDAKKICGVK